MQNARRTIRKALDHLGQLANNCLRRRSRRVTVVWDPRNFRLRYLLAVLIAAIAIAAALRHGLHVYGGISREGIRSDALVGILVVVLATVFLRKIYRR